MAFPCAPWNSFIWLTMKHKEPHIACSRVPAYNPQVPQIIPQVPYWLAQHKDSIDGLTGCPEKAILKAIISINVNRSAKGILPLQVPLVVAHIVLVLIGLCDICTYEASGCVHCWSNDIFSLIDFSMIGRLVIYSLFCIVFLSHNHDASTIDVHYILHQWCNCSPLLMMALQRRRAAPVHEATRILQVGVIGALFRQLPHNF